MPIPDLGPTTRKRRRRFTPDEILAFLGDAPRRPMNTSDLAQDVREHYGYPRYPDGIGNSDVLPALVKLAEDGRLITSRHQWARRGADMPTDDAHRYLTDGIAVNANERVWATPAGAEAWKVDREALEAQRQEAAELTEALSVAFAPASWIGRDEVLIERNGTRVEVTLSTTAATWLRDALNAHRTETP